MINEDTSSELEKNVEADYKKLQLEDEVQAKKTDTFTDNKAFRMMQMMGYKQGLGLGKNEQGIKSPVEVKSQLGTRGLGLELHNLEASNETWDYSAEQIKVEENVDWLENTQKIPLLYSELITWQKEDIPLKKIDEESNFCDKTILSNVINGKNIFDELDVKELNLARAKANPFETIRSVFFMNRAALKMANIDAATGFIFTNIDRNVYFKNQKGPFYFADVCAGPGGFTEYVLWRKKWLFKGFGFTLRGEHDFKVNDSTCISPTTFLPFYGAKNDGDVCCPENIEDFKRKVLHETENKGVHFMMSDGGFSVDGNENIQEILSKKIYTAQCLVALEILRTHGNFVTKLFDVFTNFSVGLLFLMYRCFEKVAVFKPNSSRPANSERYFICMNLKSEEEISEIRQYLKSLVNRLWSIRNNANLDVVQIVPLETIQSDLQFFNYINKSNNEIAEKQTTSLRKLAVFCRNPQNSDQRQEQFRKKCLTYWQIPDRNKLSVKKLSVDELVNKVINQRELLLVQAREITNLNEIQSADLKDWHYVPMQCTKLSNICNFYAGVGMSRSYRLQCNKWVRVKNLHLICGTIFYGELVKEQIVCKNNVESYKYSVHVIDALRLGEISLADFSFEERQDLIGSYCKAVNHEFRQNALRVRKKSVEKLQDFNIVNVSGGISADESCKVDLVPVMGFESQRELFEVNSVLFLKTNQNQSFHSTYVLRLQIFLTKNNGNNAEENCISLEKLTNFFKKHN